MSAFIFLYPFFPAALAYFRSWSTRGLRRLLPWTGVINTLLVLVGLAVCMATGLSMAVLHRWAPFRLPQFLLGIITGLLAQRPDAALSNPTQVAEVRRVRLGMGYEVLGIRQSVY